MEQSLQVGPPEDWLGDVVGIRHAQLRVHDATPSRLRELLRPWHLGDVVAGGDGRGGPGWIVTRVLDGRAQPPLREEDPRPPGSWVVEFAFERPATWRLVLGVATPVQWRVRALEARSRAFVDLGLQAVEQWACMGHPELTVTLGRCPPERLAQAWRSRTR